MKILAIHGAPKKRPRLTARPQTKEKRRLALKPWRDRSGLPAPQFWPTNGTSEAESATTTIITRVSIRPATASAATDFAP